MVEIQAERLALLLAHAHLAHGLPVLFKDFECQACIIAVKFVVQHVADRRAVDCEQGLACLHAGARSRAARIHAHDF